MKIPPLPEIDLARICPLPLDQQRRALEAIRYGHPPYSYQPVRANLSDILSVRPGMFDGVPATPWSRIEADIKRRSKSDSEEVANLRVGRGLFDYVREKGVTSRRQEFLPLTLGGATRVTFWHPAVVVLEGQPLVPFFDPRRTKTLTREGRRFVMSAMHERIRVADPDWSDVGLGVFQFSLSKDESRAPILTTESGVSLFSFDELDDMVRQTYSIWTEVWSERVAKARRTAGGRGPLI